MSENRSVKRRLLVLCLVMCLLLCSCAKNPSQDQLYAKLLACFEEAGYSVLLLSVPEGQPVGIADASCWRQLHFSEEGETPVMVYFDESNRADYLKTFVDTEVFGLSTRFGQRFVLTYNGTNEDVISLLKAMDQ